MPKPPPLGRAASWVQVPEGLVPTNFQTWSLTPVALQLPFCTKKVGVPPATPTWTPHRSSEEGPVALPSSVQVGLRMFVVTNSPPSAAGQPPEPTVQSRVTIA